MWVRGGAPSVERACHPTTNTLDSSLSTGCAMHQCFYILVFPGKGISYWRIGLDVPVSKTGAVKSKFNCGWLLCGFENSSGPMRPPARDGSRHSHTYTSTLLGVLSSYEYKGGRFSCRYHPNGQPDIEQILCT